MQCKMCKREFEYLTDGICDECKLEMDDLASNIIYSQFSPGL